jgi:glycosyltransferase involved in cell wall biosynthesis
MIDGILETRAIFTMLSAGGKSRKSGLTILTYPTLPWREHPVVNLKRVIRVATKCIELNSFQAKSVWLGGHAAVTRSVQGGLNELGIKYNINPTKIEDVYEVILVLAGAKALRQAIRMKQERIIKSLYAGPNIVETPIEECRVLENENIDKIIVPSKWVGELYRELSPTVSDKIIIWAAGIDTKYWNPASTAIQSVKHSRDKLLIYKKRTKLQGDYIWKECIEQCHEHLSKEGLEYRIIEYGAYTASEYRKLLRETYGMIYWSDSTESQGIALIEAWAMGVKTYIARNRHYVYQGNTYAGSAAPYLSLDDGNFFDNWDELKKLLPKIRRATEEETVEMHKRIEQKFSCTASAKDLLRQMQIDT